MNRPQGTLKIVGMLRTVQRANMFVPENQPDRDMWYRLDPDEIGAAKNTDFISKKILYVETEGRSFEYPISVATQMRPNNNHAHYMVFWFMMAFMMGLIYVLRFIWPQKSKSEQLCG